MIGLLDTDYKRNITVNDTAYFLNKKDESFTFASALEGKQELDTTRVDNIIDFIKFAKTKNENFVNDGYPETRWGVFDTYLGFGGDGWPQLLDQYNSEKHKALTSADLAINWNTSTMYYFSTQD